MAEDRIAYLTVLEACGRARQWDEVLKLYAEIEERFPDFIGSDMMLPAIAAMREASLNGFKWNLRKSL